jgi:hypothetical protein
MKRRTLKFDNLVHIAAFSRHLMTGYLTNTNNLTITAKFSEAEIDFAVKKYKACVIETTDKVFDYGVL